MATKNQTKIPPKIPPHVKITKNNAWISHDGIVEIPVSKTWIREYVEYMLVTNQEIIVEVAY
jgi:hypothetical protein